MSGEGCLDFVNYSRGCCTVQLFELEVLAVIVQSRGALMSESLGANLDKKLTMPRIVSNSPLSLGGSMSLCNLG